MELRSIPGRPINPTCIPNPDMSQCGLRGVSFCETNGETDTIFQQKCMLYHVFYRYITVVTVSLDYVSLTPRLNG